MQCRAEQSVLLSPLHARTIAVSTNIHTLTTLPYLPSTTSLPYAKMDRSEEKQMFRALDVDEDGLVSYREYCYFFRDMINRWLTVK